MKNFITKERVYDIVSYVFLFIMFAFMCLNASKQSLWGDELDWFVDFISKPSISDMLNYLLETGYNLPLSYLMMYPIYRIVPYGELWILMPNIIITIISVFIMKKIGKKIGRR